jgi:hypothetical protein
MSVDRYTGGQSDYSQTPNASPSFGQDTTELSSNTIWRATSTDEEPKAGYEHHIRDHEIGRAST